MPTHQIGFAIALLAVFGMSACTHPVNFHPVEPPEEVVTQSDASVKLYMRPELIQSSHSFRSALSGIANKWVVNYGARAHEFAVKYLSAFTQADLNRIALRLNQRPRKTLDFRCPADVSMRLLR